MRLYVFISINWILLLLTGKKVRNIFMEPPEVSTTSICDPGNQYPDIFSFHYSYIGLGLLDQQENRNDDKNHPVICQILPPYLSNAATFRA